MAQCADIGYEFLLFSFSSLGKLEEDAVTLLKRIQKFSMTQDIGARAAVHIFNRNLLPNFTKVQAASPKRNLCRIHAPWQGARVQWKFQFPLHSCSLAGSTSAMKVSNWRDHLHFREVGE
ncbi:hypothetical protein Tco_0900392 [Tanacetum coccineum]